ncbi:hypothetical protein VTN02DRAFT_3000 [Thermoascus thermophilus]
MQSSSSFPRPSQRPYPAGDQQSPFQPLPAKPGNGIGGTMASQAVGPRTSSSSAKSQSSRSSVPDKQLSQIEKSVTHLLVATKQLLETLTQWSRKQASENEVSDVYVRLGYEFNLACRAFSAIGVDTADLGPVPDLLRTILEDTLSQDASPQSLDRYLPRIRDIIINLLHGLKKKQARLRSRQARDDSRTLPGRQTVSSIGSSGYDEASGAMPNTSPKRSSGRHFGSSGSIGDDLPGTPRSAGDSRGSGFLDREASRREAQRSLTGAGSSSSLSSATMQNIPVQPPYTENESTPPRAPASSGFPASYPAPPPPPPPPKQDDALGALQRSGELERRASRRFSAYQIQKHLGASSNGVPMLPTQNSPLPNRGRDVRESLNAVRLRGFPVQGKQRSSTNRLNEISPSRNSQVQPSPSIAEEGDDGRSRLRVEPPADPSRADSPMAMTPEDKLRPPSEIDNRETPVVGGALPNLPHPPEGSSLDEAFEPTKGPAADAARPVGTPTGRKETPAASTPPQSQQFTPEQSPSPGKELTLFLQYKSKIKKYVLPEGSTDLTIGRLQLAFIEKFAWNTQHNGADLPEIYIQDPVSGVRHELEDLSDVKDRSVLVLNVEPLDEVKKHFDDGLGGIRRLIESVKGVLDGQESAIQRVADRQVEAAKEMARLAAAPPTSIPSAASKGDVARSGSISGSASQIAELQSLRRDLAVLRQTYSNFSSDIAASMNTIRTKANSVKNAAEAMSTPSYEGDAGRARVNSGKKELADESERLVARVDDLQDLVEDLRKDVVSRGVRPLPRQLESVSKDITEVTKELKKMQEFLKREKPIWTKIWEQELQLVCEERDQLTMQEDLAADLQDDLEKAAQTFALVEQATKQQTQSANGGVVLRSTSRNLAIDQAVDPMKAKDDVLGEVRALQPNHESRLEAIERAEKARQKELESRKVGLFQKELGEFVEEGKLKKSGGVEEAERLRRAKDERIRKEVWEREQARQAEMEKREREAAEAAVPQEMTEHTQKESNEAGSASDTKDQAQPSEPMEESNTKEDASAKEETADNDKPADPPGT